MKTVLAIFAAGAVLLLAASAWAQTTPITPPTGTTTTTLGCVPPELVPYLIGDGPGIKPSERSLCERFCRDIHTLCRNLAGINRQCLRRLIRGAKNAGDDLCRDVEDPADRSDCLESEREFTNLFVEFIEMDRRDGIQHCSEDHDWCVSDCND